MASYTYRSLPISSVEFSREFRRCRPLGGWGKSIGVANSGGPDSTCLLFLVHRYLTGKSEEASKDALQNVLSFTIDHDLQEASARMALQSRHNAEKLGVKHVSFKIPWGSGVYPDRPGAARMESDARRARYHALFDIMTREQVNTIAFGHHGDDQVETALIRLSKGSTAYGAAGMQVCRRWGMGEKTTNGFGYAGHLGMKRWVVRPLLEFSKDRILATCEANDLDYASDPTNFQPEVTLRNAIRQQLRRVEHAGAMPLALPTELANTWAKIDESLSRLDGVEVGLDSGYHQLRSAIAHLTTQTEDSNAEVDAFLARSALPSPPGTLLFQPRSFKTLSASALSAFIFRTLRYLSPHPWGSLRSAGNRRASIVQNITSNLWKSEASLTNSDSFDAGAGVQWKPVVVRDGEIRTPDVLRPGRSDYIAWLACRKRPARDTSHELTVEVTPLLLSRLDSQDTSERLEVLYDNRFLVTFDLAKIPKSLHDDLASGRAQVKIIPGRACFIPIVVLHRSSEIPDFLHTKVEPSTGEMAPVTRGRWERPQGEPDLDCGWVTIQWIRPLTAL